MSRIPRKNNDAIDYLETRQPVWNTHLAQLGLTASAVTALGTDIEDVREKFFLQQKAKNEAKAATLEFNNAMERMRDRGAQLIKTIDTTATANANPDAVYAIAQVDPPAPDSPTAAPEAPNDFTFTIETGGALGIAFKSKTDGGRAFWNVERKLQGQPFFTAIGGTPTRKFIDSTLPAGTDSVTYRIRGLTGTQTGAWSAETTVSFGVGGGGGMSVSTNASDSNAVNTQRKTG